MKKPKEEMYKNCKHVAFRLTEPLFEEWKRQGGTNWIRIYLAQQIEMRKLEKK
jgi:hypothetical protein